MLPKNEITQLQKQNSKKDTPIHLVFSALSDPSRLHLFKVLQKNENVCVSDAANILKVSVPAASRQLKILESSGLIEKVRKGQMTCFKANKANKLTKAIIDII